MVCYCKVVCQHCAWNYVNFNLKMVGNGVYFGWVGRGVTVGGHECSEKVFHLILSFSRTPTLLERAMREGEARAL